MSELQLQDNIDKEIEPIDSSDAPKPLSGPMKVVCYLTSFLFICFIVYIFSGTFAEFIGWAFTKIKGEETLITRYELFSFIGVIFLIFTMSKKLGDYWRAKGTEIGTSVTNLPNPFKDPSFKKGSIQIKVDYEKLYKKYTYNINLYKKLDERHSQVVSQIEQFKLRLNVLLRHHDNASRLISSLNYVLKSKNFSLEKIMNETLAECITVLESDQSDKSISLFEVSGECLKIRNFVRINTESAAKRRFKINEGFAGYIWGKKDSEIVDVINYETDERFKGEFKSGRFKSIMGIPLAIDDQILGVLCLQSESERGFCNDDLRAVTFYAQLCTLILLYDNIEESGGDVQ